MTTDERTPYLKCLIHETKKVYKKWLILVGAIGAVLGVGYVLWAGRDEILRGFEQIGNWFASVRAALSSVPWWLWVLIGIFVAPVVYAAVKCLLMRRSIENSRVFYNLMLLGITGGFVCMVGMVISIVESLPTGLSLTPFYWAGSGIVSLIFALIMLGKW